MLFYFMLLASAWVAAKVLAQADEPAAEQCVGYSRTATDSFNLVNNCDSPIEVAICIDDAAATNCTSADRFARHSIAGNAQVPGVFQPLQILSIFACRMPAVVRIESGGRASCDPTGTANLPLLLTSSLKNAASIITPADYPRGVTASGTTRFEMVVAADGRPQSCTVTVSSGKDALDKATCNAFMKRARFTPAKGANGLASAGRYRGNVTWKEQ
ncbi:MAG: TonB family protein [Sphingorhabdus sp.]|uniref:TonB family protein n=1 Tax=Sphingorhabdus sp. TaxID=1902408 RepID=UPI003C978F68